MGMQQKLTLPIVFLSSTHLCALAPFLIFTLDHFFQQIFVATYLSICC